MLKKHPETLHDNDPCCGCGAHCLEECPNFHSYKHPEWTRVAYCSYVQEDLSYYDGWQASCHNGIFTEDERVIRIEVIPKGELNE